LCSDPKDIQQYQELTGAEETVFSPLDAGLILEDGHTSSKHPPPHGGPGSSPRGALCDEEDGEGCTSIPALLCEEPRGVSGR